MGLLSSVRYSLLNLISAKLRSFLAILGILVGTGSVVALISCSQLATAHALAQFKALGTNLLSLNIEDANYSQSNAQSVNFTMQNIDDLKKSSPQVRRVAPYVLGFESTYFGPTALNAQVVGATHQFAVIAKAHVARGRFIYSLDQGNAFCVIGNQVAKKIQTLGVDPLGNQIKVGTQEFTVVGILKPWTENLFISANLNQSIIVPVQAALLLNKQVHINNILIRLIENPDIHSAKTKINATLTDLLPGKRIIFNSPQQLIQLIAKQQQTYSLLLIAIGAISLVVGGIGVMNIMLVSVIERRREIGVRMALGARRSDILRMFLLESVILTLFGGLLGVVVGVLASYLLTIFTHWGFHFYLFPVVLGFVVSMLVGIFSGYYPARSASKLSPVECFRV